MAWRLAPSRRVLVASPDYLERHGAPGSIEELDGHRGIFYTNRGVADWRFPRPEGAVIVRAQVSLRVNNGAMMRYNLGTSAEPLAPGAAFGFSSRLEAPKEGVRSVSVTFEG